MRLKIAGVCLIVVLLQFEGCWTRDKDQHAGLAEKIYRKTKRINKKASQMLDMLDDMNEERTCCASLTNMSRALEELNRKVPDPSKELFIDLVEDGAIGPTIDVKTPQTLDECLTSLNSKLIPEENARIWCLRVVLWQHRHFIRDTETDDDIELLQASNNTDVVGGSSARVTRSGRFIRRSVAPSDITQPPTGFRTRQEYRTLSLRQRRRFHRALNELYNDGTIECFSVVHRNSLVRGGAHGGAAFLAWHRPFITLFEEALRQVDPGVSLPYWDSRLDDNMPAGPALSVMWDEEHLGNGNGLVVEGPFAGWVTRTNPLTRDIASGSGRLVRESRVEYLMTFCTHGEFRGRWENSHNGVHRWVGGTMARSWAASDPVFYMHHAFVDYVWEKFRQRQRDVCGVDPASDYPPTNNEDHHPDERMDGMRFLRNRDGIADYWTDNWFRYEEAPSCENNCGDSPDLFCDEERFVCVSEMRFDVTGLSDQIRKKRQADDTIATEDLSSTTNSKMYTGSCSQDPYARECLKPQRLMNDEQYVEAMVRHEIPNPIHIGDMHVKMQRGLQRAESFPPENEEVFFQASPEEPGDCRTADTCSYDLANALVKEKKLTNKGAY